MLFILTLLLLPFGGLPGHILTPLTITRLFVFLPGAGTFLPFPTQFVQDVVKPIPGFLALGILPPSHLKDEGT